MSDTDDEPRYRASPKALATEFGDGVAILHSETNVYYSLDPVGSIAWNTLARPSSLTDLVNAVRDEFDVAEETCRADLQRLLDDMTANELVETV